MRAPRLQLVALAGLLGLALGCAASSVPATTSSQASTAGSGSGSTAGSTAGSSGGTTGAAECAGASGPFYGPCDAAGPGTCLPGRDLHGQTIGRCVPAGTASMACQGDAGTDLRCAVGQVCAPSPASDGGAICQLGCDPTQPVCPPAQACLAQGFLPQDGVCVATGAGGCLAVATLSTELLPCLSSGDCACPQACVAEPGAGGSFCEFPCATLAGGPTPITACWAGRCSFAFCGFDATGAPADAGTLGGPCDLAASGDGMCVPFASNQRDDGGNPRFAYGLCAQTGTAPLEGPCDPTLLRDAGSAAFCSVGSLCASPAPTGEDQAPAYVCAPLCDPRVASGCAPDDAGPQGCFSHLDPGVAPAVGSCFACADRGQLCARPAECCSGVCQRGASDSGIALPICQ